jgi:hypothetical protein
MDEIVIFPPKGQIATRTWMEAVIKHLRVIFATKIKAHKDNEGHGVIVKRWDSVREAERLKRSIQTIEEGSIQAMGLRHVLDFLISVLRGDIIDPKQERKLRLYLRQYISSNKYEPFHPLSALSRDKKHASDVAVKTRAEQHQNPRFWLDVAMDCILNILRDRCHINDEPPPCLIGHNIIWDLAFIRCTFGVPQPPQKNRDLVGLKSLAWRIFDTKILAKNFDAQLVDLDLPSIYFKVRQRLAGPKHANSEPEILWDPDYGYVLNGHYGRERHHDAGYDSRFHCVFHSSTVAKSRIMLIHNLIRDL